MINSMKVCGNCKHWQKPADEYSGEDGTCLYYVNNIPPDMPPAPFWVKQEKSASNVMCKTSAKTILCKVFEAAELLTPNAREIPTLKEMYDLLTPKEQS